jgi:hypothetical protein
MAPRLLLLLVTAAAAAEAVQGGSAQGDSSVVIFEAPSAEAMERGKRRYLQMTYALAATTRQCMGLHVVQSAYLCHRTPHPKTYRHATVICSCGVCCCLVPAEHFVPAHCILVAELCENVAPCQGVKTLSVSLLCLCCRGSRQVDRSGSNRARACQRAAGQQLLHDSHNCS